MASMKEANKALEAAGHSERLVLSKYGEPMFKGGEAAEWSSFFVSRAELRSWSAEEVVAYRNLLAVLRRPGGK